MARPSGPLGRAFLKPPALRVVDDLVNVTIIFPIITRSRAARGSLGCLGWQALPNAVRLGRQGQHRSKGNAYDHLRDHAR